MSALMDAAVRSVYPDRCADISRHDRAAAEADGRTPTEADWVEADVLINDMKKSGEWDRRRWEHSGRSMFEQQFIRDHQR